jgi:hypothetical protein
MPAFEALANGRDTELHADAPRRDARRSEGLGKQVGYDYIHFEGAGGSGSSDSGVRSGIVPPSELVAEHETAHVAFDNLLQTHSNDRNADLSAGNRAERKDYRLPKQLRRCVGSFSPHNLWTVPALLILIWLPFTPPPSKHAQAQQPPVIKPADPFDDINLIDPKRNPRVKYKTVGGMPVLLGVADLK